jgi:hypothetical protein
MWYDKRGLKKGAQREEKKVCVKFRCPEIRYFIADRISARPRALLVEAVCRTDKANVTSFRSQ